jgi:hypothetical protein
MPTEFVTARNHIDGLIRAHGWAVLTVEPKPFGHAPTYSYTVGLHETHGHPEILMVGLDQKKSMGLLNAVGSPVRGGARFGDPSRLDGVIRDFQVWLRKIPSKTAGTWAIVAKSRYRRQNWGLLQMFYPDAAGLFPWDDGCDAAYMATQGLLLDAMPPPGAP